ncbi:hypothetical protein [Arthrobacter sp. JSM 101049]|uniref:hypothetical protein n=1 Tax=Arthrobacter sp. JSM 101049 TaxID=929097 RepID=UPI00356A2BE0
MATQKPPCDVEGCETEAKTRGKCGKHYQRMLKHGDPLAMAPRGGAAVKAKTAANPPTPLPTPSSAPDLFEAVWPITGIHNRTEPTPDEAQGLCTIAMFEIHKIARATGAELLAAPTFAIIRTASNPRAAAHPEAKHCPYTLRATVRATRRQGATA